MGPKAPTPVETVDTTSASPPASTRPARATVKGFISSLTLPRLKPVGFLLQRGLPALCRSHVRSTSVLTLRVSHGEYLQALITDVEGGIEVPVMQHATMRANPGTVGQR